MSEKEILVPNEVPQNIIKQCESEFDKGNSMAQWMMGIIFYFDNDKKDPIKAVECWKIAAKNKNGMAQMELAKCYLFGCGVAKDHDKSEEFLLRAAEHTINPELYWTALSSLGICCDKENPDEIENLCKEILSIYRRLDRKRPGQNGNLLRYCFYLIGLLRLQNNGKYAAKAYDLYCKIVEDCRGHIEKEPGLYEMELKELWFIMSTHILPSEDRFTQAKIVGFYSVLMDLYRNLVKRGYNEYKEKRGVCGLRLIQIDMQSNIIPYREKEKLANEIVGICRKASENFFNENDYEIADCYRILAFFLEKRQTADAEEMAEELLEDALSIYRYWEEITPGEIQCKEKVASSCYTLGRHIMYYSKPQRSKSRKDKAERLLRESLQKYREIEGQVGKPYKLHMRVCFDLARLLQESQGENCQEAKELIQEGTKVLGKLQ